MGFKFVKKINDEQDYFPQIAVEKVNQKNYALYVVTPEKYEKVASFKSDEAMNMFMDAMTALFDVKKEE